MKITILQGAFLPVPPQLGGAVEKMWFALGKEFAKKGHQVTHISRRFNKFPVEEVVDGVRHTRVKGFNTPSSGIYLKWLDLLYTLAAKSQIPSDSEVVVTNTFWAPVVLGPALKKRCFVDVQRLPKGQMGLYKKAGRLRANSTHVAEAIEREITNGEKGKVVMIPNPLPFEFKKKADLEQKKRVVLYAGRIHPEKGLELLIRAFRNVKTGWMLKIVGPFDIAAGGGGKAYCDSLKSSSEGLNVEFIGPVYDSDRLNQYYQEATVFVYPSIAEQGETFGLAPLEAMVWGCVPVVSNLSCFQGFIRDGENGLVFDHRSENAIQLLEEAIMRLLSDADLTSVLAAKASEVRNTHSTSLIAGDFLNEFENLIREIDASQSSKM